MERFERYHKIKKLGDEENEDIFKDGDDEIIIEEKIDGANFRFMVKGNVIILGSRTRQLTSDEGKDANISKNFKRCAEYVRQQVTKNLGENNVIDGVYYGECCVKHTLAYDWDAIPPFLGFDIKAFGNMETHYIDYDEKKQAFELIGLPLVPLISRTTAETITDWGDKDVPDSIYFSKEQSADKQAEGVVFKNYKKQVFAKYVRDKFKEENALAFGGSPKYNKIGDTNNADLAFKYCTNARIDKIVFKMLDEGMKLEMALMKELPKRVYDDICEEHWKDVMASHWKIDFGTIRKTISKRCGSVLRQIITNNELVEWTRG